ncbi:P-loop containing nucleoside triphosphate hydrolase protein [Ephemerocybe angulata]|uniref:P-loop containing nucleoside triphosphate hydrolase protein n=1 Tax=Ephemerocybe angulata TaxID=980116 RepID=A0A8H6M4J9_9AGAR|nr:P-loop containing nucleoside triphosphate hydrolase protein [Tulosesus angulatus]
MCYSNGRPPGSRGTTSSPRRVATSQQPLAKEEIMSNSLPGTALNTPPKWEQGGVGRRAAYPRNSPARASASTTPTPTSASRSLFPTPPKSEEKQPSRSRTNLTSRLFPATSTVKPTSQLYPSLEDPDVDPFTSMGTRPSSSSPSATMSRIKSELKAEFLSNLAERGTSNGNVETPVKGKAVKKKDAVFAPAMPHTPPPSEERGRPGRRNLFQTVKSEEEEIEYLKTPTKATTSSKRGVTLKSLKSEKSPLPALNLFGPPTPETSPVRSAPPVVVRSKITSAVLSENQFTKNNLDATNPTNEPPPFEGLFRPFITQAYLIQYFDEEVILVKGKLFISYKCKNGHVLEWYQALDFEMLVCETLTREEMKLDGNVTLRDIPKGRCLTYYMGLGKTHVAVMLILETLNQLRVIYQERGVTLDKKPVLIIAGKSIHKQWMDHFENLSGGALEVEVYAKGGKEMPKADVIIATNEITRSQYGRYLDYWEAREEAHKKNPRSLLKPSRENPTPEDLKFLGVTAPFFINEFFYLIMDEFHDMIKNPSTLGARASLNLVADHVLLLSGTPAQNNLYELSVPLALLTDSSKRKDFRGAEAINRMLNRGLDKPKSMKPAEVVGAEPNWTETLISQTMITRGVQPGNPGDEPLIQLPTRTDYVVMVSLTEEEMVVYDHMRRSTKGLAKIMRSRQVPNHSALVRSAIRKVYGMLRETEKELDDLLKTADDVTDEFGDALLEEVRISKAEKDRAELLSDESDDGLPPMFSDLGVNHAVEDEYLSSKFKVVLGILRNIRKERKGEKAIIFSTFASLLELLSKQLDSRGIDHVTYLDTGDTPLKQRHEALEAIASDKKCRVILVSMKAGGVGK